MRMCSWNWLHSAIPGGEAGSLLSLVQRLIVPRGLPPLWLPLAVGNPKGIPSQSPGLPQRGYPGKTTEKNHNPDGVVANVTRAPDENGIVTTALRLVIC